MPFSPHHQFHALFHHDWYEAPDRYQPSNELLQIIHTHLPMTWRVIRTGGWFTVLPIDHKLPHQGWKIHVSAIAGNCEEILRLTAAFCVERNLAFKFALDTYWVTLSTSKLWSREASGKFITIYPHTDNAFCETIEDLYGILCRFKGPYILSDRRYKDAEVLYYRYGGMTSLSALTSLGTRQQMLHNQHGELVPDERMPYWNPPAWVKDPCEHLLPIAADEYAENTLCAGKYQIQQALQLSVAGGVYLAQETQTGRTVIVKEARHYVHIDNNRRSAVDRLQSEYAMLQSLQETGITPQPLDLFWDWEHLFLVEEYIPGPDLRAFIVAHNPLIKTHPNRQAYTDYLEKLKQIWSHLAHSVDRLHQQGIIYGDFSFSNVLISDLERGLVRLIDLETAYEEGSNQVTRLATPGFSRLRQMSIPGRRKDVYSIGALMLGTLFPVNTLFSLDPTRKEAFLHATSADLGLSAEVVRLIEGCLNDETDEQPGLQDVLEVLSTAPLVVETAPPEPPITAEELTMIVGKMVSYIHASADVSRDDRLFPADPAVFSTNSLSIAYGAAGVLHVLHRLEGSVPLTMRDWLLSRCKQRDDLPPGLYLGTAGLAWVLWELGEHEHALKMVAAASMHRLLWEQASLYSGAAGYGLTCLHLYLESADRSCLERAQQVGAWLLQTKTVTDEGYCWPEKEGTLHLGYAQGASGIALYLLYLGIVTQEKHILQAGRQALAFDLAHLRPIDEEGHLSVPRNVADASDRVVLPYWLNGSVGIATVLLRFWISTGDNTYREILEHVAPITAPCYSVFPGLFQGLAGLGNFDLDAYQWTGNEEYLQRAYQIAHRMLLFKVERPEGIAFPGDYLSRISTDFGTGSAGIALFSHRLLHARHDVSNGNFVLDQIFFQQRGNATH